MDEKKNEEKKPLRHADVFISPRGDGKEVTLESGSKVCLWPGVNDDALFEFTRHDGRKTYLAASIEAIYGMVYLSRRLLNEYVEKKQDIKILVPKNDLPKEEKKES